MHMLEIIYKERTVTRERVDIRQNDVVTLRVESINFPVTINVFDGFGRPVEGLGVRVTYGGEVLLDTTLDGLSKEFIVPAPGYAVVEVTQDGKLLVKEAKYLSGPTTWDVVIKPYLVSGGALTDVGLVITLVSAIALIIPAAYLVKATVLRQR